jgi:hypothetical protein
MRRILLHCTIMSILMSAFLAPRAEAGWSLEPVPNVPVTVADFLWEVNCEPESTNLCMAVGRSNFSLGSGGEVPVIQRWNGTSWTLEEPAIPDGTLLSALNGVWCGSTSFCVAVGSYRTLTDKRPALAETWNGSWWSVTETPSPAGATSSTLAKVACSTTSACTAVGSSVVSSVTTPMAVRWNGSSWSLQTVPVPTGATAAQLDGIGCPSSTFCMAVGNYTESGKHFPLSATWNGSSWTLKTVPSIEGVTENVLRDVGCNNASACTAVGIGSSSGPYAYRWNGTSWSVQTTSKPAGAIYNELKNVSCATTTSCTAVGYWTDFEGKEKTLAESWNGSSWSVQTTPNPSSTGTTELYGTSCRGSECVAVGFNTISGPGYESIGLAFE